MSEEMAIVEELHDINRKLTAGIQVDTYGEMRVINRAANAITRLTEENAKLKREVDMAEKQSLDFYVEKENAALTSNRAMLNAEATRLTNTIIERNKKIDLRGDNIAKLLAERDELREQLRWSPSEDQIMAAITSSNCGLKRVKWKDGIDINLPSGEALSFVAAILEFRPKQDKGSDK